MSAGNFLGERLRARRRVGDDKIGVVRVHRQRTTDDHFARQIAGLLQYIVNAGPMHSQQQRVGVACGFSWCPGPCVAFRLTREALQLLFAVRVAEDDVVSGTREDRSELAAHQA